MNKPTNKKVLTTSLIVNKELNVRLVDNYDLPTLVEQIKDAGRIIKPVIINGDTNEVLSGNRRTLAAQAILADPNSPQELVKELEKIDCVIYTGLTPEEITNLVFDHGSEKAINRTETLLSVWRLDKQLFSEKRIASLMYFALANYTGNTKKLREVPSEPAAREKFVHAWFRGTLGNYMLSAHRMGQYVRDQMVLTHLSEDKMLKEGETVQCRMSRDRITALSAAKTADSGAKGWSAEEGGENFNKLLEQFKAEDAGAPKEKVERPSAKALTGLADMYQTPALRRAFLVAAGDKTVDPKQLAEDDAQLTSLNQKLNSLLKHVDAIKDANIKDFVGMLLSGTAADVEKAMLALTK